MTEPALSLNIPGRISTIRTFQKNGGRVAAVFPIHYPRALFRAFDILPVEVWGPPAVDTALGDARLQTYACDIVRRGLSYLLAGKLDLADLILVPHACDSLQGLGSLLTDFVRPQAPVLTLYLPRTDSASGQRYLAEELRGLRGRLAEITGRQPDDAMLLAAIKTEEAANAKLAELLSARRQIPLADRAFYELVRAREYLPAEDFVPFADQVLASRQEKSPPSIPIVLSGIVPEPMEIFDIIAQAGGLVAADDLCSSGRRLYPPGQSNDPFERMAQGLLQGPVDSTRGCSIEDRLTRMLGLAEAAGARGVIFYLLKFCEPEQFYLPLLRKGLEKAGIRSVVVEGDLAGQPSHQVATRIEAFLETLA